MYRNTQNTDSRGSTQLAERAAGWRRFIETVERLRRIDAEEKLVKVIGGSS